MAYRISVASRNAAVNAHTALFNQGANPNPSSVNIYSTATSQPASPETALPGGSVLLAQVSFSGTAFNTTSNTTGTANNLPLTGNILATGTAGWFRFYTGSGTPQSLSDGTVTLTGSGGDMTFDNISFPSGGIVTISNLSISQGM